jgi:hypothetical protein
MHLTDRDNRDDQSRLLTRRFRSPEDEYEAKAARGHDRIPAEHSAAR